MEWRLAGEPARGLSERSMAERFARVCTYERVTEWMSCSVTRVVVYRLLEQVVGGTQRKNNFSRLEWVDTGRDGRLRVAARRSDKIARSCFSSGVEPLRFLDAPKPHDV